MTLAGQLAAGAVLALPARVFHARRGPLAHRFNTAAGFVLLAPDSASFPVLMGRNRFNLTAFYDRDHGGPRGAGEGASWAWAQFAEAGLPRREGLTLALLTQPRFLGFWFNPVSFWLLLEGDQLRAVIAEVNNTFGQRHSYLLTAPDLSPITPSTRLSLQKVFHVSPFQDVSGDYQFRFSLSASDLRISIRYVDGASGVDTLMQGAFAPLTSARILGSALRRPGGAILVVAQIYWHALRLKLKGALYRRRPSLPFRDLSR